jgi:hypothetical protein
MLVAVARKSKAILCSMQSTTTGTDIPTAVKSSRSTVVQSSLLKDLSRCGICFLKKRFIAVIVPERFGSTGSSVGISVDVTLHYRTQSSQLNGSWNVDSNVT